jgi:hypothetical protein
MKVNGYWFWQLNADWEGAVSKLVCSPLNKSGFWEKGYFKAKLGRQTVHFENGKFPSYLITLVFLMFR